MKKDKRINASMMSRKNTMIIFLLILWCCGSYMGIYALYLGRSDDSLYMFLSLAAYMVCLSLFISYILVLMRRHFLMKPLQYIGEGTRKMASGDLSVRLQPRRKDGKMDEVEVLIEDFNIMAEELSSIELLKSDFISTVSHELKTPLAQISNYASVLQSDILTEEEKEVYIGQIGDSARRLSELVTNILQLNRLDNQKIQPQKTMINVSEQISECVLRMDSLLEEKDIWIDFEIDEAIWMEADAHLMEIVWNNLLTNAIKFVEVGGRIQIQSKVERKFIRIFVRDNGCGMTEQELKHIFDKFYQADTSRKTAGNGIGLALVKRIVDLMQFEIEVTSEKGRGSSFCSKIPAV